jgi:putative transposase
MSQKKSAENFVEHEVQALLELENFIASNPDPRELKRAVSIRMLIEGVRRETIQKYWEYHLHLSVNGKSIMRYRELKGCA